ncbi:MAG: nucleotidyltransferase domain-containing protein [Candidatus Latescibacterota bacterium]
MLMRILQEIQPTEVSFLEKFIMNAREQIGLIPEYIAKRIAAKKIILFGSYAYGSPGADSDIDLCVITDLAGRRKIDIMREVRRAIASFITHPVDILVYEEDEFNERAALKNTMEHKIAEKGVKLLG